MTKPVISVKNLGKTYWLYPTLGKRLLGCFVNPRMVGGHAFTALKGLSFDLYPGEAIALIGKNGAGKSTALQVLAGITPATEGSFQINGRVCALLELGSGFNPEFTGRQNIALAGILLGLTREQVKEEEQNIIDFADIGEFIDQPVKFYSSGMFVRLAFAVAVAGTPDLLVVDEALAVGDIFFRQKCYARLREMREKGMAVILVTHNMADVTEFCDRAILLEHGKQIYSGDTKVAAQRYFSDNKIHKLATFETENLPDPIYSSSATEKKNSFPWPHIEKEFIPVSYSQQPSNVPGVSLLRYCLTNENDLPGNVFSQGEWLRLYSEWEVDDGVENVSTGLTIYSDTGQIIYSSGAANYLLLPKISGPTIVYSQYEVELPIKLGEYSLSHSLGTATLQSEDIFHQKKTWDWEDWLHHTRRLGIVNDLAVIAVTLPLQGKTSRVMGWGLVNLPTKCVIYTQNQSECFTNDDSAIAK